MYLIGGSASTALAERISRELENAPFGLPFQKRFPDGEMYVRIGDSLAGADAVIVQSTRTDADLVELLLLKDAAREAGARRVFTVVPYFAYARQDRRFYPGEPVSARAVANVVELGSDAVVTVELHSPLTLGAFSKPIYEVSGIPALARLLAQRQVDLIVSPDKGGVARVERMAKLLDKPWIQLAKHRIDSDHVELSLGAADREKVRGARVAIVDDVISTGGTIVESAKLLARCGAASVAAACVHGLFLRDAFERIKAVTDGIYSTDTLVNPAEKASVAPDIAQILRQHAAGP